MRHDTRVQLIAAGVLIACIAASGVLTAAVAAEHGRAQLGYADRAEESDPPEVAVGIAMGAFRGLFVNILWLRAQHLKQEGKFYEAVELSKTITRLQPRFPRVWGFHAWNMAYNISVATPTSEERWQWIQAAIRLLRDEGIPKNPNDVLLHKELAWIYLHKIQGFADDSHHTYKREVAYEWTVALGPPPQRADSHEETTERYVQWLKDLADAPGAEADLIERHPAAGAILSRIRDEAELELDFDFLRHVELIRAMSSAWTPQGVGIQLQEQERNAPLEQIIVDMAGQEEQFRAFDAIISYTRKKVLADRFNMELPRMIRYTRKYGPLDWRHAASHGLYWATRGVEEGSGRRNLEDFDFTNTDRLITHGLQELFRWGQISYDILNDSYVQMLDLQWTDTYGRILREDLDKRAMMYEGPAKFEDPTRTFRLYSAGYENFLRDVVRIYYRMGRIEEAQEYYRQLRTYEYRNMNDPMHDLEELSLPLAEFVEQDIQERMTSPDFAQGEIMATLMDAYLRGLLQGRQEVFEKNMNYAFEFFETYMEEQNFRTSAEAQNRMAFTSEYFVDVAADAFINLLQSGQIGRRQASLMFRRMVGSSMRTVAQTVWDRMQRTRLAASMEDFQTWFPEPPGMSEYRAMRDQLEAQSDEARQRQIQLEQQ